MHWFTYVNIQSNKVNLTKNKKISVKTKYVAQLVKNVLYEPHEGTDQLCGNSTADQRLCFYYISSTFSRLPKYKI